MYLLFLFYTHTFFSFKFPVNKNATIRLTSVFRSYSRGKLVRHRSQRYLFIRRILFALRLKSFPEFTTMVLPLENR